MRFRKLRIAVTVLSLTACVLLIGLWVRSYYSVFRLHAFDRKVQIVSWQGLLTVNPRWIRTGFSHQHIAFVRVQYSLPVLLLLTLGGLPWVQWYWGFSLRAL